MESIRATLIRKEETIIFAIIERAQHRQNSLVYEVGGVPGLSAPPGSVNCEAEDLSFLDYMLTGTEALHSNVRRYESPEEHAFFPDRLPKRSNSLETLDYPDLLCSDECLNNVNLNWNQILYEKYINVIVPAISAQGDDEQYGSSVVEDIVILQALSKRIHFGKFVAESKYQSDPVTYQRLVDEGDADGVMELLTNMEVERRLLTRAKLKAATYGREPLLSALPTVEGGEDGDTTSIIAAAAASAVVAAVEALKKGKQKESKMDPEIIEFIYRDLIIPMTKDVEVAYLFLRCGKEPPPEYAPDRMSVDVTKLGNSPYCDIASEMYCYKD